MKQKKLIFNFFVNRNWKKLTDSRKRAKILADNRKNHHPIETLLTWTRCRCYLQHLHVFVSVNFQINLKNRLYNEHYPSILVGTMDH